MTDESASPAPQPPQPAQPPRPPTNAAIAEPAPKRPTWALVIGIIAIVIALLGIVMYGLCTPVATVISSASGAAIEGAMEQDPNMAPTAAQLRVSREYAPLTIGNACMIAALGVVLLIGGIGLVRTRPWARATMLWWAVLRIIAIIPGSIIGYYVQMKTFVAMDEAVKANGGPMPGMYSIFTSPALVVAMVGFGALFAMALPVFTLIWFNRPVIREQCAGWSNS